MENQIPRRLSTLSNSNTAQRLLDEAVRGNAAALGPLGGKNAANPVSSVLYNRPPEHVVEAFDPNDDELAGVSREEMLAELGKTGVGVEQVSARVVVDGITGEKQSKKISDSVDEPSIDSLQDLSPESIKKQLSSVAKQNIMMLMPGDLTDAEADELVGQLEAKIVNKSKLELQNMSASQIRDFVGERLYAGIGKNSQNPTTTARRFLLDLKDSIVEIQTLMNTMEEMNLAMAFFEKNGISDLQATIQDGLNTNDVTYETELHKYVAYLGIYIEKMKAYEGAEDLQFVRDEIAVSEEKIKAITEALSFERILSKTASIKEKIKKDFKQPDVIDRAIWDFIGRLHNDQSISVTFPVPKNTSDKDGANPKKMTGIWIAFLEMVGMQQKFPVLQSLGVGDYSNMGDIVYGQIKMTDAQGEPDEYLENLKAFAVEHHISREHFLDARKMAIIFTYILARTFKPARLNDTYTKYVLSYTMNILAQSLNPDYKVLTHRLFDSIKVILTDSK